MTATSIGIPLRHEHRVGETEEAVISSEAGFQDSVWARRDPDIAILHGEPEFERLYPEKPASPPGSGPH